MERLGSAWAVASRGRFALKRLPLSRLTMADGMVMVGSAPPIVIGSPPAALLATITARAPAFCAFLTLITNVQKPRSSRAIFPATLRLERLAAVVDGAGEARGRTPRDAHDAVVPPAPRRR